MNKHKKLKELIAKTKGNEWRKDATGKEYPVVSDAMDSLNYFCGDNAEEIIKLIEAAREVASYSYEDMEDYELEQFEKLDKAVKSFTEEQE